MSHPFEHAKSSARKFGGCSDDYQNIHDWFDESKMMLCSWQHRALRHHSEGIFMAERFFGTTIANSEGKQIPVRLIGEQHVKEDLGWIPSVQNWFEHLQHVAWMTRGVQKLNERHKEHL